MYQKRQISLPVQNRKTTNRRLGMIVTSFQDSRPREKQICPTFSYFVINKALLFHFLANWLAQNKKMTEKSVFREAWSPEMTSQSFPVSCFWFHGFVPTGSEIWRFWHIKTRGRKIAIERSFLLYYISTLRRFNRANKKKNCHIHLKLNDVIELQILYFVYQWSHRLLPPCFSEYFKFTSSVQFLFNEAIMQQKSLCNLSQYHPIWPTFPKIHWSSPFEFLAYKYN